MSAKSWDREYSRQKFLPSSRTTKISRALRLFLRNDVRRIPASGLVLDLGCGLGRNTVALAQLHRQVIGLDYSREAIRRARHLVRQQGVAPRITYRVHDLTKRWPAANASCTLAIDMSCIHLLNERARRAYARELTRVLRPGGYFLIFTIASSAVTRRWRRAHPGPEPGSYVVPLNGHVEKSFTRRELISQFGDLRLVALRPMSFVTHAFGKTLLLHYHRALFQKPKSS